MASVINSNIASLNAQRNLTSSQMSLTNSIQRLSSGLRINSAKDDAAGLAIATRMTSQINGLNQATRNANDGISLAQTAESALGQIGDNLQRMRELSVQAANGSLSSDDRKGVQKEIDQLKNEIDRVGNQTAFNGTKLLDGSSGGFTFQVGADANQTIAITSLTDTRASALGTSKYASTTGTAITLPTAAGTALTADATSTAAAPSVKIGGFTVNGVTISGSALSVGDTANVTGTEYKEYMSKTVDAINAKSSQTGVTANLVVDTTAGTAKIEMFGTPANDTATGDIVVAAVGTDDGADAGIDVVDGSTTALGKVADTTGFSSIDVSTISGANKGLTMLDGALKAINNMRADLGAVQNRFSSTVTNLQATAENLTASRSRIQDTDFASETASMTRGQILQQAGTAMLAQANSLPNGVLSLLR
ncbi:MAG: flagellin [Massilia sp.]